jgi:hypothetical protein
MSLISAGSISLDSTFKFENIFTTKGMQTNFKFWSWIEAVMEATGFSLNKCVFYMHINFP